MKVEIIVDGDSTALELDEKDIRIMNNLSELQKCTPAESLSKYLRDYLEIVSKHEDLIYKKMFPISVDTEDLN